MTKEEAMESIVELEWEMLQATQNVGGRAECQDNWKTFVIMRFAQAEVWELDTLLSYLDDLQKARINGDNLIAYKYGYMMEVTYPEEYLKIKDKLPETSAKKRSLVDEIAAYNEKWADEAHARYPKFTSRGRPTTVGAADDGHATTVDVYLRGELLTYSEQTLALCLRDTEAAFKRGENLTMRILQNTASAYGYSSLDKLEATLG